MAMHAAIITVVLVTIFQNQMIDATVPFRWNVVVVEKETSAPTTVETVVATSGSRPLPSHDHPTRSIEAVLLSSRAVSRPNIETRASVQIPRPVVRKFEELEAMDREVSQQKSMKRQEDRGTISAEPMNTVTPQERFEQSNVVSSQSATAVISDAITRPSAMSQPEIVQSHGDVVVSLSVSKSTDSGPGRECGHRRF